MSELDQTRVQLAGCLVAAEGHEQDCFVGDYGWSPAYQAVIELRKLYERAAEQNVQRNWGGRRCPQVEYPPPLTQTVGAHGGIKGYGHKN